MRNFLRILLLIAFVTPSYLFAQQGEFQLEDAIHTFNMGIGWMIVVAPAQEAALEAALPEAVKLGAVTPDPDIQVEVPWA